MTKLIQHTLSAWVGSNAAQASARSPFVFDLRLVGLFRVLLALTILLDQFIRLGDWHAFYSNSGLLSLTDSRDWHTSWGSLYWMSNGPWLPYVLEALRLLATLTLLLGMRSRLSAFVLFALLASLVVRNPLPIQGGDWLLVFTTFFAVFLPLGEYRSLARWWFGQTPPTPAYRSVATIAYSIQVLGVWFMAGLLKTGEQWTDSGTALSMALHLEAYVSEFARLWRGWDGLVQPMTFFVLWVERLAPLLALVPVFWCRLTGLAALVVLVIGIWLNFELGLFPLISLVALVPLFPPRCVDALVRWWSGRTNRKGADLLRLLPGAALGDRLYAWIAQHRDAFGSAGAMCFGQSGAGSRPGPVGAFVVSVALGVVVAWNVVTYPEIQEWPKLGPSAPPKALFHLSQYWPMFAPHPHLVDTYHVMPALARDGSLINLLPNRPLSLEPPRDGPDYYGGYRWRAVVFKSTKLNRIDRMFRYLCSTGQWTALDFWEFSRPNLGTAATADAPHQPLLLGRTRCPDADESTVDAFRADIDAMMGR